MSMILVVCAECPAQIGGILGEIINNVQQLLFLACTLPYSISAHDESFVVQPVVLFN